MNALRMVGSKGSDAQSSARSFLSISAYTRFIGGRIKGKPNFRFEHTSKLLPGSCKVFPVYGGLWRHSGSQIQEVQYHVLSRCLPVGTAHERVEAGI